MYAGLFVDCVFGGCISLIVFSVFELKCVYNYFYDTYVSAIERDCTLSVDTCPSFLGARYFVERHFVENKATFNSVHIILRFIP